jgi:hypothetical protein
MVAATEWGRLLPSVVVLCYDCAMLIHLRLQRTLGCLLAVLLPVILLQPAMAENGTQCPPWDTTPEAGVTAFDPSAEALMASIERDHRHGARIVRMDIHTQFLKPSRFGPRFDREPNQRTLWGISSGNRDRTDLLYVFSGPGRMAGTALLIHDQVATDRIDETWLYLRAFDIFEKIEKRTKPLFVPGTALSYEDSRGFIPIDKFWFLPGDPPKEPGVDTEGAVLANHMWILACPRSSTIAKQFGYSSLLLNADRDKRIVRRVEYRDLSGHRLKTYRLHMETEVGERHFPRKVELEHYSEGFLTTIEYEYWQPERAPKSAIFEPSVDSVSFIDRLQAYVVEAGPGERLKRELELADEQSREFTERVLRNKKESANRRKNSAPKSSD